MGDMEKRIELLKEANRRMTGLLSDPQPGLLTWVVMVGQVLDQFRKIQDGTYDDYTPRLA